MKILSCCLITFLLAPTFHAKVLGQTAETKLINGTPESVGISSSHLNLMDDYIGESISENRIPGGVFFLARKGKIIYFKSFGNRSNKKKDTYQNDHIFRIASMTKAVTTVSIMQLYERGKLHLDDPVHKFLPAFKAIGVLGDFNGTDTTYTVVPPIRPITIRHLLTHTSGITYGDGTDMKMIHAKAGLERGGLSLPGSWTSEDFIDKLASLPLSFHPGERYHYGLNMDVLGRVVEVISGLSLNDYFRKNIFEPLGMNDTWFYLPKPLHGRLVPVYVQSKNGFDLSKTHLYPTDPDHPYYAGGGGLSSTAMDYATFIQALLNGGSYNGKRILGRKTIEVMTSDQMILLNEEEKGFSRKPGVTYGLGFSLLTEKAAGISSKSPGTYEWGGYFSTKFFIDPEEELIFVGMTQVEHAGYGDFWNGLYQIMYGAIED